MDVRDIQMDMFKFLGSSGAIVLGIVIGGMLLGLDFLSMCVGGGLVWLFPDVAKHVNAWFRGMIMK